MFDDSATFLGRLILKIAINDTVFDLGLYYIVLNYLYLKKNMRFNFISFVQNMLFFVIS